MCLLFLKPVRTLQKSDVLQSSPFIHILEEVLWFRYNFHLWDTSKKPVTERNPGGYLHFNEWRGLCYIGHLRPLEMYYKPFQLPLPQTAILQVNVLERDNEVKQVLEAKNPSDVILPLLAICCVKFSEFVCAWNYSSLLQR